MAYLLTFVLGYLLGAIPFGLILGKVVKHVDVREYGSKRTGATNVMRVLGPRWAVVVFMLDFCKGACGALVGRLLAPGQWGEAMGALAAVIGHIVPVYIGFRGGRGVASGLGGVMAIMPVVSVSALVCWMVVVKLTRYVSLGSILGCVAGTIVMALLLAFGEVGTAAFIYSLATAAIIIIAHRDNIGRLLAGTESKL